MNCHLFMRAAKLYSVTVLNCWGDFFKIDCPTGLGGLHAVGSLDAVLCEVGEGTFRWRVGFGDNLDGEFLSPAVFKLLMPFTRLDGGDLSEFAFLKSPCSRWFLQPGSGLDSAEPDLEPSFDDTLSSLSLLSFLLSSSSNSSSSSWVLRRRALRAVSLSSITLMIAKSLASQRSRGRSPSLVFASLFAPLLRRYL